MLEASMDGAKGVLLSVSGPSSMTLHEATEAARVVADHADAEADIIFGAIIDDDLIAAGFEGRRRPNRPASRSTGEVPSRLRDLGDDDLEIPSFVQG
jgi:cell division protein FtsZ